MKFSIKLSFYAGALCLLTGVFFMYTRPEFLVILANQVWSCF